MKQKKLTHTQSSFSWVAFRDRRNKVSAFLSNFGFFKKKWLNNTTHKAFCGEEAVVERQPVNN
jgi:hypothetical protein